MPDQDHGTGALLGQALKLCPGGLSVYPPKGEHEAMVTPHNMPGHGSVVAATVPDALRALIRGLGEETAGSTRPPGGSRPPGLPESEATFQSWVIDYAHAHGWLVSHFRPARTEKGWRTAVAADGAGFPDLVLVRERVVFAELKGPRGTLRETQWMWARALEDAGAEHYVWRPQDRAEAERVLGGAA
jgi:hypothetical protein